MILEIICSGPVDTNSYLLGFEETKKAVIIDPSFGSADELCLLVNKYQLEVDAIYLTHSHWDHFADLYELKKRFNVPVYVHSQDAENVRDPGSDGLPLFFNIHGVEPDHFFSDQEVLRVGNVEIKVLHTPGHSPGGVCFYLKNEKTLISGDTLFKGSIGNLSFSTADPSLMWKSLKKLALLPPETKVYPGHGPSTTIGEEDWLTQAEEIFGAH